MQQPPRQAKYTTVRGMRTLAKGVANGSLAASIDRCRRGGCELESGVRRRRRSSDVPGSDGDLLGCCEARKETKAE